MFATVSVEFDSATPVELTVFASEMKAFGWQLLGDSSCNFEGSFRDDAAIADVKATIYSEIAICASVMRFSGWQGEVEITCHSSKPNVLRRLSDRAVSGFKRLLRLITVATTSASFRSVSESPGDSADAYPDVAAKGKRN